MCGVCVCERAGRVRVGGAGAFLSFGAFIFLHLSFAASRSTRTCLHTDAPERGVARRENAAADVAAA